MRDSDYLNIRDLGSSLWTDRWLIIVVVSLSSVAAIVTVISMPDVYRAQAVLTSNTNSPSTNLADLAGQFGGLAQIAGLELGRRADDKAVIGLERLKSRQFISEFIARHDALVPLMAATDWDRNTGTLTIDDDVFDPDRREWVRDVSPPRRQIPSAQEAYEVFMDGLTINSDSQTGLIRISIDHVSPVIAQQWVEAIVHDINQSVMAQDVREAEQAIEFLNGQLEQTSLSGLQSVFYGLIEEQTKIVLLAEVSNEYLFKTIDPAVVPEFKHGPARLSIVILSVFISAFFAAFASVARHLFFGHPTLNEGRQASRSE